MAMWSGSIAPPTPPSGAEQDVPPGAPFGCLPYALVIRPAGPPRIVGSRHGLSLPEFVGHRRSRSPTP